MASELRLTTLANNAGTESVDTTYVINGSVKAWGYLNGDNTTFYDSFGMSSASDEGTGDTNFTLSSAMSSTNFAVTGAAGQTTDNEYATNFCANNKHCRRILASGYTSTTTYTCCSIKSIICIIFIYRD